MKLVLASGIVIAFLSTSAYSAPKERWCCMVQDKVATFESKGKKRNICLRSVDEPKSSKSSYVKKCKTVAGKWFKQDKKKKG